MWKKKRTSLYLTIPIILVVLVVLGWFIANVFEGEQSRINLQPTVDYLSKNQEFKLNISDKKRGLRTVRVSLYQEGRDVTLLDMSFPFKGLLNQGGTYSYDAGFFIDPSKLNLAQGRADLIVRVWDHSRRGGGEGNLSLLQHSIVVDTIPPAVTALGRLHYINAGGAGMVVYQASSDSVTSGVFVGRTFHKGFTLDKTNKDKYYVCYFAYPPVEKADSEIFLWTEDRAGNQSKVNFYCRVRKKLFLSEKMDITDVFLERVLPYFSPYLSSPGASNIEKFLDINQKLRARDAQKFNDLRTKTSPIQLWEGQWVRLKNAKSMANFGDRRIYYYKGKEIDNQLHMGVDLASLANAEVPAANSGRIILAESLGIYGNTVVVDHGQGLSSVYAHLSRISVALDQTVKKAETIGLTGQTGLAVGDHLHFGIMVNGVFVNPLEWWDPHWVQDNITRKLNRLEGQN
jgi:hypothetical protein